MTAIEVQMPIIPTPHDPGDVLVTHYQKRGEGPYPFTETGTLIHRRDLAGVEEPLRSAIEDALHAHD